ncbi:hypothetical protein B0H10DRAFT_1966799 [Mycena sp. CBHHK59/15]|nr:hypothetical protein B0H10DRAFT_1966799 [Mycena sp. CBHHK59/15]
MAPLAPATEAPTARRVLRMIPPIGDDSGKCGPLLEELQLLSKAKGDFFSVCSKGMMFVNERQKKHPQYSGIPFQPFGTVGGLIHCNPHSAFTIGLAVWPEDNPVDVEAREHKAEMYSKVAWSRCSKNWLQGETSLGHNKRPERNNDGICLTLALEWMVELVDGGEKGLGIQRNRDGEVIAVKEFRMIDM